MKGFRVLRIHFGDLANFQTEIVKENILEDEAKKWAHRMNCLMDRHGFSNYFVIQNMTTTEVLHP